MYPPRAGNAQILSKEYIRLGDQVIAIENAAAPAVPIAQLSATSLSFAAQTVGTTSAAQSVMLTDSGTAPMALSGVNIGGTNPGDFVIGSNGCGTGSLAAGAACAVWVEFTPAASGSRNAVLSFADSAAGSPQTVSLVGIGSSSSSGAPSSFTSYLGAFGSGTPSYSGSSAVLPLRTYIPGGAGQITILQTILSSTNTGGANFSIFAETDGAGGYSLFITSSAGSAPWPLLSLTPSGNTVTLSAPITLGALSVTAYRFALVGNEFQLDVSVSQTGTFSDQIIVLGMAGTNYSAPWMAVDGQWSSTATASPAATLSSKSVNFGNDTVSDPTSQTLTITNTGSAPLSVGTAQVSGADAGDFTAANGCGAAVAPGGYCTISVTFDPESAGARTATLTITDNAASSPEIVTLMGTGLVPAPTVFTTYLGTYGVGFQTFSGSTVTLPIRVSMPGGAGQITTVQTSITPTSGGDGETIYAESDGAGGYSLVMVGGGVAVPWPSLALTASGSTVTLATPITAGPISITAYRFALVGNELQLDLTLRQSGSFSDQVTVFGMSGTNYSSPWNVPNGQWGN